MDLFVALCENLTTSLMALKQNCIATYGVNIGLSTLFHLNTLAHAMYIMWLATYKHIWILNNVCIFFSSFLYLQLNQNRVIVTILIFIASFLSFKWIFNLLCLTCLLAWYKLYLFIDLPDLPDLSLCGGCLEYRFQGNFVKLNLSLLEVPVQGVLMYTVGLDCIKTPPNAI